MTTRGLTTIRGLTTRSMLIIVISNPPAMHLKFQNHSQSAVRCPKQPCFSPELSGEFGQQGISEMKIE
jgi:hypothetical protein